MPGKILEVAAQPVQELCLNVRSQVDIHADGPVFASHAAEQVSKLIHDGHAPRRDHFRHKQASEDAVLVGNMSADRQAGAFLSAERDLILVDQLADVFKSYG